MLFERGRKVFLSTVSGIVTLEVRLLYASEGLMNTLDALAFQESLGYQPDDTLTLAEV